MREYEEDLASLCLRLAEESEKKLDRRSSKKGLRKKLKEALEKCKYLCEQQSSKSLSLCKSYK